MTELLKLSPNSDAHSRQLSYLRGILAVTLFAEIVGLVRLLGPYYEIGALFSSLRWIAVLVIGIVGILLTGILFILTWTRWKDNLISIYYRILHILQRLGYLNYFFFVLIFGGYTFLLLGPKAELFDPTYIRFALLWMATLCGGFFLKAAGLKRNLGLILISALLLGSVIIEIAALIEPITSYPFSLDWSEASRYYFASLYLSQWIYGFHVPPPTLHPTRYLMEAAPFLIPNTPILVHRLWQQILWAVTALLTGVALVRQLSLKDRLYGVLVAAWVFLFVLIPPVYYHLLVPVILVLFGFNLRKKWQTLLVILIASAWVGLSRVNWFPIPAMLAVTLYLLKQPVSELGFWRYLLKPVVWGVLGLITAYVFHELYIVWSGIPPDQFSTSFSSSLLWYRLLPNPTYRWGIFPAAIIVSLPFFGLIAIGLAGKWRWYHPLRYLGLGLILGVLFAGGLLVSVKIGGGSNLHNLDAYLTFLLTITAFFLFQKVVPEPIGSDTEKEPLKPLPAAFAAVSYILLIITLLLPIYFVVATAQPITRRYTAEKMQAIEQLKRQIKHLNKSGGEVLLLTERQLLTFHFLKDITLVPEYEKTYLMEMVMGGNQEYLNQFYQDISNHRFSLIISEPLSRRHKGSLEAFGEENDVWVDQVSTQILCYYQPQKTLKSIHVQILAPRTDAGTCTPTGDSLGQ